MNSNFQYLQFQDYLLLNPEISKLGLKNLECKHIANATPENAIWLDLANKVGYEWAIFGSHRKMQEEKRLSFEINRIIEMSKSQNIRPIRIVKTSNDKYFVDNTHWALAMLMSKGKNVKLIEVPFYIVDFTQNQTLLVDVKNSVIDNQEDKLNAINAAYSVEERIKQGWRPKNYTFPLENLYDELNLDKYLDEPDLQK